MINLTLATNTDRRNVLVEADEKVADVIEREGVDMSGAQILLKGQILSVSDQQRTFDELGVADGTSAIMNVAVKAVAA